MSLSDQFSPWSANGSALPAEATQEDEPVATGESSGEAIDPKHKKMFIAVDGVEATELTEDEAERLERHVLEFVLTETTTAMPTGVRVIRDDSSVVEIDYSPEEEDATVRG